MTTTVQNNEERRICWKEDVTFVWSALEFGAQWFALAAVIGQFSYCNNFLQPLLTFDFQG